MPLLPSASDSEPFLILTDQDYEKAVAPEAPPAPRPVKPTATRAPRPAAQTATRPATRAVPAAPVKAAPARPAPKPKPKVVEEPAAPPNKRWGLRAAAAILILAGAGGAFWWSTRPAPVAPPVAMVPAPEKPAPKVEAPSPPPAPKPRPAPVVPPPPVEEPVVEETPAPVVPPPPPAPWSGGRAWVEARLRTVYHGTVQELERKVVIVWDGSRFVIERPEDRAPEAWMARLELLLQLPQVGESWPREVTNTSKDTVTCAGATLAAERVEGEDRFPQEHRRFTYWTTPDFGGGAIRASVIFPDVSVDLQVLAFGPEPESPRKP